MFEVGVSEGGIEAVDEGKNEVRIGVGGWDPATDGPGLDRRVDRVVTGRTAGLSVPEAAVSIEHLDDRRWTTFEARDDGTDFPPGTYVFKFELSVSVYVGVNAPCRLEQVPSDGGLHLRFDRPTPVTIGFRSRIDRPRQTITVPPTVDGARTAIRWFASGIDAGTPDKSYPTNRAHPPAVAFGDSVDVPPAVRAQTTTSDVTLRVPASFDPLFVVAPLSYYLQADVQPASSGSVQLEAPSLDRPLDLGTTAPLETDVAAVLQRVFHLDCLVRNAGPYGVDLREFELLDEIGLDADDLYDRTDGERLAAYLRSDYTRIADRLPDWHLSVVVAPEPGSLTALPYLLHRLSLVQLAEPVGLSRRGLIAESVESSYVDPSRQWATAPSFDLVRNRTRLGELQGWMTGGTPVDAFRATVSAFEHRFRFHDRSSGPRRVVVVINDELMLDEREAVERIYRSRSEELSIEVSVVESLTRDELRAVFRSSVDFLHFIGHCDASGLRCRDGAFSTATLESTDVQTFFLNACGSFDEGLELVRRGSVAGAVTLANVLNLEATRVGMTFTRLVMHGFSVSRALSLASRRSLTNKFYAAVGDGTHRLSQGEEPFPAELAASRLGDDEFELRFAFPHLNVPGGLAWPRLPPDAAFVLRGCPYTVVRSRAEFVDFLASVTMPVVFEGAYHWSTDLADGLAADPRSDARLDGPDYNHPQTNNN